MKHCKECGVVLGLDNRAGRLLLCKGCKAQYMRDYYKNNPDKYERQKQLVKKNYKPKKTFEQHNLSEKEFEALKGKFNGLCWVCKSCPGKMIDHSHECCSRTHSCGTCVRGWVCGNCNSMLGFAQDDENRLTQAIEYLRGYRSSLIN